MSTARESGRNVLIRHVSEWLIGLVWYMAIGDVCKLSMLRQSVALHCLNIRYNFIWAAISYELRMVER